MKVVFAFALLIAGTVAWPSPPHKNHLSNLDWRNERLISDSIAAEIQAISQSIRDAGLDPLDINNANLGYALPVPVLFSIDLVVDQLISNGLSNIVINNINYALLTSRLTFDIELPSIEIGGKGSLKVVLFGSELTASLNGGVAIVKPRLVGNIRVSVGIITGISIRSVDISFTLDDIQSDLNVVIQNADISNWLNTLLGSTIPNTLRQFSAEINELLEIIVTQVAEEIL